MAIFEKKAEEKTEKKSSSSPKLTADVRSVLVKPRISEKAAKATDNGKYVFEVRKTANKISIRKAVEQTYNVKVNQVNIINTEGKTRNYGRTSGKMSDFKKAIVTLKAGDRIEGFGEAV